MQALASQSVAPSALRRCSHGTHNLAHATDPRYGLATMKPSKQPPSDEVLAFMSFYAVPERLGRPRERILTWLARLQPLFQGADAAAVADGLCAKDARLTLFYLEGLLKLYVQRYPELTPHFEKVKALEDVLGSLAAAASFAQWVKGVAVPESCVAWCEQQQVAMREHVVDTLGDGWLPDAQGRLPMFGDLLTTLTALEFDGYRKDRKAMINEIRRRLAKLADSSLDMYQLQGNRGLHELRRQLRWIPIYCVALDGLVVTDATRHPIKSYAELISSDIAKSPYARLPEPTREDKPIAISFSLFLANTHFISELGRLKDSGEILESVEHALLGSGVVRTSVDAHKKGLELIKRTPEEQYAVHVLAENLYKEVRKKRLLERLRADFRR